MPRSFSGLALQRARAERGVSREALALAVDRTVHTITAYELGRAAPSADMAGALADVLDCPLGDLFTANDDDHVQRLIESAIAQGHPRHVGDVAVLRRITDVLGGPIVTAAPSEGVADVRTAS